MVDIGKKSKKIYKTFEDRIKRKNIKGELEEYGFPLSDELLTKIYSFLDILKNMPTEYFEGKFNRFVDIFEFSHALIPEGKSPKTKDILV